jgi:SAM-dependent methyltransferase
LSSPVDHFSAVARAYAGRRPGYPDELFAYLSRLCLGREFAWDCGAGSGQASLPLAHCFGRVVASDLSPAMLALAPSHPRLHYVSARAQHSPLREESVDLVTVAQALHWFDIEPFYHEVDRVLVVGGVLAVWSYGNQVVDDDASINQALAIFYRETVGPFWAPARRHVESGYATLPFPYPELNPPAFAMERRWTLDQLLGYIGTWSATQHCRESTGSDPVPPLRQQLKPLWGDASSTRLIRWPLSLRVGRRLS